MKNNIADIRREYMGKPLSKKDVSTNPFEQFNRWFDEALYANLEDPTAMTLATASKDGRVSSRIVLLKGVEENEFVFYTNYNSLKGRQLEENPQGSLTFYWPGLIRQIRIEGRIEKLPGKTSDEYFNSRPRDSQISAMASAQSSEIPDRKSLEEKTEALRKKYEGKKVPRPEFWGGYALKPGRIEFWQGRENRLHDRIEYLREENRWQIRRLAP
jgi:pyridoxamine 5'-phosphate oxidase